MSELLLPTKPKLGFVGVGWIGRNRLEAVAKSKVAEIEAISDANSQFSEEAKAISPFSKVYPSMKEILATELDGVIIATPSALHATQSIGAIDKGKAVFCQKPLGRNAEETRRVVQAAQEKDVLLGVDFSYRYTKGIQKVKETLDSGELGEIFGANLVFHNAYGPDKSWYFDPKQAGGGCVMDLGVHLVDLVLWLLKNPAVSNLSSNLFAKGALIKDPKDKVEDYATAQFLLEDKTAVQLSCSWNLPAGCDAVIEVSFYGTNGGVSFRNVNGSFYDFVTERFNGTSKQVISSPPDDWGGKAAVAWAKKLAEGNKFNQEAYEYITVAEVLDKIYQKK